MKNSFLLFLLMLIASPAISQINTFSPYTRYGLGDLTKDGFGQNLAMGGTGIALHQNNHMNYLNPASYSARDSMSVIFDFGLNSTLTQYQSSSAPEFNWWNGNFHHIGLSVPIGKHFGLGTGLVPYSSVGYNIKQEYDDLRTGDPLDFYYHGDGGILKYFLGVSGELFDRVSIGVNMNYLLGDINRQRFLSFPSQADFSTTSAVEDIQISHTSFGFGIQYKEVIADKFFFTIGGTYDLQATFNSSINNSITNIFPPKTSTGGYINDSTFISTHINISGSDTLSGSITLPSKIGLGIAFGIPDKLTVTADYTIQDWESASSMNDFLDEDGFKFVDTRSMHFGIEYTPDFEALRGYHKLMSYRVGGYYSDNYVSMLDHQMKDYGITFGVGLPMNKSKSSFNVAFTLGTRGTTEYNYVKENYGILTFSVTLHDLWFYKRKFD